MNAEQLVQLDLFGQVEAAERQAAATAARRRVDALRCLRDSVPEALGDRAPRLLAPRQ